jgi:CheY-like chemotaxis protein
MANILWIDDKAEGKDKNRLGFNGLIFFIEKNGHTVDIASSGEQIENAIKNYNQYNLIILDIIMDSLPSTRENMQQFGGFDVLEILSNFHSKVPIIILSVMSQQMVKDEAMRRNIDLVQNGVKEVLRKGPILPSELAKMVENILNNNKSNNTEDQI